MSMRARGFWVEGNFRSERPSGLVSRRFDMLRLVVKLRQAQANGSGAKSQSEGKTGAQRHTVLGIRMTTELATDVKVEAAKRGMSVATLFEEVWQSYVRARQSHVRGKKR
jgi:hypothetical protein